MSSARDLQHDCRQPVADEVVDVARDLAPLGDERLLGQLTLGVLELVGESFLANDGAGDRPREHDAHHPDRDGDLRRLLDQGHQHGGGRSETRARTADLSDGDQRPTTKARTDASNMRGSSSPVRCAIDDRGDHGDRQDEERRSGHERPDEEGDDGHRDEKEVGGRGRLGDRRNQTDHQRDDRHQSAGRVGLEPTLA